MACCHSGNQAQVRLMRRYRKWVKAWLAKNNEFGACARAVGEMIAAFPELKLVRGHVMCDWGKRAHHWAVAPNGKIIDPTKSQFNAVFSYEPWESGDEVQIGSCMDCGAEIWVNVDTLDVSPLRQEFCDDDCKARTVQYLESV